MPVSVDGNFQVPFGMIYAASEAPGLDPALCQPHSAFVLLIHACVSPAVPSLSAESLGNGRHCINSCLAG